MHRWLHLSRIREKLETNLFVIPAAMTAGLIALSIVLAQVDTGETNGWFDLLYSGTFANARTLLSTIATATITLTGLVFSITMLVLQLASSQYSPRVLRSFLRDRTSQVTLGIFIGTFAFALSSLRTLDAEERQHPGLSVSVAVVLALVTVGAFAHYVNHIAQRIRATSIIASIATDTERVLDERRTDTARPAEQPDTPARAVSSARAGVIAAVDVPALVAAAQAADGAIVLRDQIGDFVPAGAVIAWVTAGVDETLVRRAVHIEDDRSTHQDPRYGFRQLVDIALRALSPSLNDPTTATDALRRMHSLLRQIASVPDPSPVHADADDVARVVVPVPQWADYLDLAVDEIATTPDPPLQIRRALDDMLGDLRRVTEGNRRAAVEAKMRWRSGGARLDVLRPPPTA